MKERLLNGLKDNKIYAQDARQLEIMNQTFSECVSILKGFDQDESPCEESTLKNPGGHRAQENANLAAGTPNLICHNCGRRGHKAHNYRSGTARGAKGILVEGNESCQLRQAKDTNEYSERLHVP